MRKEHFLSFLLVLFLTNAKVFANETKIDAIYYQFEIEERKALVVSGNNQYSGTVRIPASVEYEGIQYAVEAINDNAFNGYGNLKSVVILEGVKVIGRFAFMGCGNLTSVTIPNSVVRIGEAAFHRCSSLKTITLPDDITEIERGTFMFCSGITSIKIPANVTKIGDEAFYCTSLKTIDIPDGVTSIGGRAFYYCSALNSVKIPSSLTEIDTFAFYECNKLQSVYIQDLATWFNISFEDEYANPMYYALQQLPKVIG